jgi:hypothetical protein
MTMNTRDDLRVSDRERKRALASLNSQHRRGRIDAAELAERRDAVGSARTWGDLAPVFADLEPVGRGYPAYRGWRRGPRFGFFPLVPLLVLAIIIAATGHVPWVPVIVLAVLLLVFAPWRRRRWAGGVRGYC